MAKSKGLSSQDAEANVANGDHNGTDGGLLSGNSDGRLFAAMLVSCLIEIAWVGTCSTILFGSLMKLGIFRVSREDELRGIDDSKHGGSAYRNSFSGDLPGSPGSKAKGNTVV